jgi:hypothetical protein
MIAALFGELNIPFPIPIATRVTANVGYAKLTGSWVSMRNAAAATSIPPVANGRAPKRSERNPESGPAIRNPSVSGSM